MRVAAVEQDSLLDQSQAQHLCEKVDVVLRAAGAQRDVMEAIDNRLRHGSSPS